MFIIIIIHRKATFFFLFPQRIRKILFMTFRYDLTGYLMAVH